MSVASASPPIETLADLVESLGGIGLDRIRMSPSPGTATEQDVIDIEDRENRLFELVDGVLVEKVMGYRESILAIFLAARLSDFAMQQKLGLVTGSDGMMRLFAGQVRIPDVAFAAWSRFPDGLVPSVPIPDIAPDLAVEVLSRSNTVAEMSRKTREYFDAGTRLVWLVDPDSRCVEVFTSVEQSVRLSEGSTLAGADVLPGFELSIRDLFAVLDQVADQ
ncbi:MAG: Uma2 family endonuclease [Planctomycetota bacterium]|jgi:Uma2 family endonuclease